MSFSVSETKTNETMQFAPLKDGSREMCIIEAKHEVTHLRKQLKFTWQEAAGKGRAFSMHIYEDSNNPAWLEIARGILGDALWALGVKGFDSDEHADKMCQFLIGKSCIVRTKQETYQGKINCKASAYFNAVGTNRAGQLAHDIVAADSRSSESSDDVPF